MKKILLSFFILTALTLNSFSQKGFHSGIGGSYNTVWIINQNSYSMAEYDYVLDMGGAFRVDVGYNFTDHIGVQTGFTTFKGGQKYEDSHGTGILREVKMSYSGIPVLFKLIGGESKVKFYFLIGPQFSFLSKAELTGNYPVSDQSTLTNAKVRFEKNNSGLNFGLGADISITDFLYVNAGMSFLYGFSDINAEFGSGKDAYDPIIKGSGGNGTTWRFPSPNTGLYDKSNLANGGFSVGIHYLLNKSEK